MEYNLYDSYPNPSISSVNSSKGSEMKPTHLRAKSSKFAHSDNEHIIPKASSDSIHRRHYLKSNHKNSGDSGELMDLNSRFNALKVALDQRPSMASTSSDGIPSSQSFYAPISPGDLRVATPTNNSIASMTQPRHWHRDQSIGPRPSPPSIAQARQDRQPSDAGKSAAGPRLQRPTWMHHAAPSGPSASPPPRDSACTRKGAAVSRGTAPAPPHLRRGPGGGPAGGGGPARGAGRRRSTADDATAAPSPPRERQRGSESDAEEAEHRAIMRRLDDSSEWAGSDPDPSRRAELLFV